MALAHTTHPLASRRMRTRVTPAIGTRIQPAALGLAAVEAAIGYEWLLSALNKILSPAFRSGLGQQVQQALHGNPNAWWVALASRLVLPHPHLWAMFVEIGELLVALGFFAGAVLWASARFRSMPWTRVLHVGVIGALAGSALMTANYYVMSGETLPVLNPGNPFNEGLSIDGLLTLIALVLLAVHAISLRARDTTARDA